MAATIFALLETLVALLPGSILLDLIATYADDLQPFYDAMAYVNYFLPIGILVTIFTGWSASMLFVLVFYHFYKKL